MPDAVQPTHDPATAQEAIAFADGAITLWANCLTLVATHLQDQGMSRGELRDLLGLLHDTNEATIRSPHARASAASHMMAVYTALEIG